MPLDFEIKRIDSDDDPERCQVTIATSGQCRNKAVPGSTYCAVHGGNKAAEAQAKQKVRGYLVGKWRQKLDHHADNDNIKDLREDIGVMRMLVENILNLCSTENDLLMYSSKIADLVTRIEKLVSSCQRLEVQLGGMLDKNSALRLGQEIALMLTVLIMDVKASILVSFDVDEALLDRIIEDKFVDVIGPKLTEAIGRAKDETALQSLRTDQADE